MVLPPLREAETWFIDAARRAVRRGERLDAAALSLVLTLAPHEAFVRGAIDAVDAASAGHGLAALAHEVLECLARGEEAPELARDAVSALEERILPAYVPGRGLGCLEDDVAVAHAMLAAYQYGRDETHLMMAEELMRTAVRRRWPELPELPLAPVCEGAVVLDALGRATGNPEYSAAARSALEAFASSYRELGWRAAPFVRALKMIS